MSLVDNVSNALKGILNAGFGDDFSAKMSKAFSSVAANGTGLAEDAVRLSKAVDAKKIIADTIANDKLKKALLGVEGIKGEGGMTFNQQFIDDFNAGKLGKTAKENLGIIGIASNISREAAGTGVDLSEAYSEAIESFSKNVEKNGADYFGGKVGMKNAVGAFFNHEDYGNIRKAVVGGTYAAGAIGLRTLQGGDLSHNARGENDIAGIPFF